MATEKFPKTATVNRPNVIENSVIKGSGNIVDPSATNVIVSGDSNYIGSDVNGAYVLGSSGCVVSSGVKNAYIVNSSGVIITEDNQTVINNTSFSESVSNTLFKKVTLTSSQILNINTTPVELIPAPGTGKYINVINLLYFSVFNTTPYDTNTDLKLYTVDELSDFILSIDISFSANRFKKVGSISGSLKENRAIYVTETSGNPLNGDSDITLYVYYNISSI